MSTPVPVSGRSGTVKIGATAVGHVKGCSISEKVELLKDYSQDSTDPALLEPGSHTHKIDIDSMYLDSTILDLVLAGTKVTIVLDAMGGLAGSITLTNVVLTDWKLDKKLTGGAILQSCSGEGVTLAPS